MKLNLSQSDFINKSALQPSLSSTLKKPVNALVSKKVETLPFCYEADYFDDGGGFMSIGIAKEIIKLFKTKRCKGQGMDENGNPTKIDKKKVAYGQVRINGNGQVEFQVLGGTMKRAQAKQVIKSIPLLKKQIGDNFIITGAGAENEEEMVADADGNEVNTPKQNAADSKVQQSSKAQPSADWTTQKTQIKANMAKMKAQLEQLNTKLS